MIHVDASVLYNQKVNAGHYRMGLDCGRHFSGAVPGQFVTLRIGDQIEPLLRRPFSIHRLLRKENAAFGFEILYKVVGRCTRNFSALRKDDRINILGPLGTGFRIPSGSQRLFLVGGGIGIAPMVFLADIIRHEKDPSRDAIIFLGGRKTSDLLCLDEFEKMGYTVQASTENGSFGHRGLVTEPLEKAIDSRPPDWIAACGPMPMLKAVSRIAHERSIPCQVSIETVMACGMGVCMGCAVECDDDSKPYRHVCKDGPVFDANVLIF